MAYSKKKLLDLALKAIEEHSLIFVEEVIAFLPCTKPTYYSYFPVDSNEFNDLKTKIEANKISLKTKIRKKLAEGDKAAELIALYKLIATDAERDALSMTKIDHTTNGKDLSLNVLNLDPLADNESDNSTKENSKT